jgi:ATP-dependent DNA helicase DinG
MRPLDIGLPLKFDCFRKGQEPAILDLATSSARFDLLNSPVGSGKSVIYMSDATLRGNRVLVLVSNKGLQSQVHADFSPIGMVNISGHSAYSCASSSLDPDTGDFDGLECDRTRCEYWPQVSAACQADSVVTNYAHWVTINKSDDPDRLGKFDMIVLDEAHLAPDLLVDLLSVRVSPRGIRARLDIATPDHGADISEWVQWAGTAVSVARTRYKEIRRRTDSRGYAGEEGKELSKLSRLGKDLARLATSTRDSVKWVVAEHSPRAIRLSPVWASKYAEQYLYRGIPKVLLSSATLSVDICGYLGIPTTPGSMYYREVESTFDPRRRPFIYIPTTEVDKKMGEGQKRLLINQIDRWIEGRLGRKGVIQSISYENAYDIVRRSKYSDLMLRHNKDNAQQVIRQYIDSDDPCILVSPSVREGYNFADDICRHQIIYKVPFIWSGDPVNSARLAEDKGYRNYLAAQSIQQMVGRLMRREADWGETAIFDLHWGKWFRYAAKFSNSFRASWRQFDRVPPALNIT